MVPSQTVSCVLKFFVRLALHLLRSGSSQALVQCKRAAASEQQQSMLQTHVVRIARNIEFHPSKELCDPFFRARLISQQVSLAGSLISLYTVTAPAHTMPMVLDGLDNRILQIS